MIFGFMLALNFGRQGFWIYAIICGAVGSLMGAVLIRHTEGNIIPGKKEGLSVTFTNIALFFLATMLATFYFVQSWGTWQSDAILGLMFGVGLGIAQDLAAGKRKIGVRHVAALILSFVPALIFIRVLSINNPPWISAFLLDALISIIIVGIDYSKMPNLNKNGDRKSH
jgi:hypothetical protein